MVFFFFAGGFRRPQFRVEFQRYIREILVLFLWVAEGFGKLHMYSMDSHFNITQALEESFFRSINEGNDGVICLP